AFEAALLHCGWGRPALHRESLQPSRTPPVVATSQTITREFWSDTYMPASVLAVGLDPAAVDFSATPELTADVVAAFIDSQLQRLRILGYEVHSCLLDPKDIAARVLERHLEARRYDCVMIG